MSGYLCLDWIVRTYTPAWLELAGLTEDAERLRALPEIVDLDTAKQVVRASRKKAYAAWAAAWVAAGDAAWDAAGAAAWAAAWVAAGDALAPTVRELQDSAFDLLERMLPKVMIELPEGGRWLGSTRSWPCLMNSTWSEPSRR